MSTNQELAQYQQQIRRKVDRLLVVVSHLAIGKFDTKIPVPKVHDEFAELQVGIKLMLEVIQEKIDAYEQLNAQLEQKVKERTAELELAHNKNEAILTSIGDGVFALDTKGNIILFNPAAEAISGFKQSDVLGSRYDKFLHFISEKTGEHNYAFIHKALAGTPAAMENHTVLICKDGHALPVADSAAPIWDAAGKLLGAIVVFRDVTKERDLERAKNEFVSMVSHQLRTPLTPIRLFTEMLAAGQVGKLTPQQQDYVDKIHISTTRMIQLVGDVLNVSRLELGLLTIEPKPTDPVALIRSITEEVRPMADEKHVSLTLTPPKERLEKIPIDVTLFGQVVHNLLTNSIRYTHPRTGVIKVALASNAKGYVLSVADNGIGIPKEAQPRIFERFYRAENAARMDNKGTGLGLYLVKMIVEQAGGEVWFKSKAGKGTTFYVRLPLSGMRAKTSS